MKNILFTIYYLLFTIYFSILSCKKDAIITDPSAKLEFSTDTVIFDTVFTTIGSTTHFLKVYNRNNKKIIISSIWLAGGNSSRFRMNVDGMPATYVTDIEIPKKDSLYI